MFWLPAGKDTKWRTVGYKLRDRYAVNLEKLDMLDS